MFSAGLFQKTIKGDQNVKLNRAYPRQKLLQKVPEDSRSHVTKAEDERVIGGATWPHLEAAQPLGVPLVSLIVLSVPHRLKDCISTILLVGLIQGLTLDALAYIISPCPPSRARRHKSRLDQKLGFSVRRE